MRKQTALLFRLVLYSTLGLGAAQQEYITAEYSGKLPSDIMCYIKYNVTEDVYIGGRNTIHVLDKNLRVKTQIIVGPRNDSLNCPPNPASPCDCASPTNCVPRKMTDNIIHSMAIDHDKRVLIACSNLYYGYCLKINMATNQITDELYGIQVVSNDYNQKSLLITEKGGISSDGNLYAMSPRSSTGNPVYRDKVPLLAVRNLQTLEVAYTDKSTSSSVEVYLPYRDTMDIQIIHMFSYKEFIYTALIRKESPNSDLRRTYLSRICKYDKKMTSYIEVQIGCNDFSLLDAAYVTTPGQRLATSVGGTIQDEVLFTAFRKPLGGSAFCLFLVKEIHTSFRRAIELCFSGFGETGPSHITSPQPCRKNEGFRINDSYCGAYGVNHPIASEAELSPEVAIMMPSDQIRVTAVLAKKTGDGDHTVAYLGTSMGSILKISEEANSKGHIFGSVSVAFGTPINSNMQFMFNENYIIAQTNDTVYKVNMTSDCGQFSDCESCLIMKDPSCGWCSTQAQCTDILNCPSQGWDKAWLPYDFGICPKVVDVDPKTIIISEAIKTKIKVRLNALPDARGTIKCELSTKDFTFQSSATKWNSNEVICNPFSHPPTISEDQAVVTVKLTIKVTDIIWATTEVTYYDCNRISSCIQCTNTTHPCAWCTKQNTCVHDATLCSQNIAIFSINNGNMDFFNGTKQMGPNFCPVIHAEKAQPQILVHSGEAPKIIVRGKNLADFHLANLKCQFTTTQIIRVNTTVRMEPTKDYPYKITCDTAELTYTDNIALKEVLFNVVWDQDKPLDNPQGVAVTLYKCSELVRNCGKCLILDPKYNCGWCETTCQLQNKCLGSWLDKNQICPNPRINEFSPKSGPVTGGTNITVHGVDLGKTVDQMAGNITIGSHQCTILEVGFEPTTSFICTASASQFARENPIKLTVAKKYTTQSREKFKYVDPVFGQLSPKKGPLSGGTNVTVNGNHLDIGSRIEVTMSGKKCTVLWRNYTTLKFRTAPQPNPLKSKINVNIDGTEDNLLGGTFAFVEDPVVTRVLPTSALTKGGNIMTIVGTSLDAVEKPALRVTVSRFVLDKSCAIDSSRKLLCPVPDISRLDLPVKPTKSDPVLADYGLVMDGVRSVSDLTTRGAFNRLAYYPLPTIKSFTEKDRRIQYVKDMRLQIEGNDLDIMVRKVSGLEVYIGETVCARTTVLPALGRITCKPPAEPKGVSNGLATVYVRLGDWHKSPGYLTYQNPSKVNVGLIVGLVIAGVAITIIIVVFVMWYRKKKEKENLIKNPLPSSHRLNQYVENGPNGATGTSARGAESIPLKKLPDYEEEDDELNSKPFDLNDFMRNMKSNKLRTSLVDVLISNDRLTIEEMIGKGHFGCVYSAQYQQSDEPESKIRVAVKTIQNEGNSFDQHAIESFLKEGVIMKEFIHPHVLQLLGVCFDEQGQPMVILPYMSNGDLRSYVKDKKKNFTARQLLHLAQQVAGGMAYLSSLNFVHRDLAARNCMIDEMEVVKVADFGLTRDLFEKDYYSAKDKKGKMPIKWMALESLEDFIFTTKSDVWSFGVLVWELMTRGVTPYPDVDVFDVRNYLASGRRLRQPKYCPENIYQIMIDCWHAEPDVRPTFTDLVNRIEAMLNPPRKRAKSQDEEEENIYQNISKAESSEYLHPVDTTNPDGSTSVSFA